MVWFYWFLSLFMILRLLHMPICVLLPNRKSINVNHNDSWLTNLKTWSTPRAKNTHFFRSKGASPSIDTDAISASSFTSVSPSRGQQRASAVFSYKITKSPALYSFMFSLHSPLMYEVITSVAVFLVLHFISFFWSRSPCILLQPQSVFEGAHFYRF